MRSALRAVLFEDYDDNPRFLKDLTPYLAEVVMSVAQEGGLRNLEVVLGRRLAESFIFSRERIGKRLIILGGAACLVAEGTVMVPSVVEGGLRVSCIGPYWDLCFRQVYNDAASWVSSCTTSEVIKDILTDECPGVNSDQTNIDETSTDPSPWQTAENAYPGELIPRLGAMSDSQHREWYFWLKSGLLSGSTPQKPVPYFKPQDLETIDFWFDLRDFSPLGFELSPSLMELANDVRVMYRDSAGSQQQTSSATDSLSQSKYWLQEVWDVPIATVPPTVANQYRDMYLARYKNPQQSFSFRINGWVWDKMGTRHPLWKVIQDFPCNLGVRNLVPEEVMTAGIDREQVFAVAAARYSYARNELTITPDLEEKTMENLLALWMGAG